MMRRFCLIVFALACSLMAGLAQDGDNPVPRFEQNRCTYQLPRGVNVVCGFLVVPEDHNAPEANTIRLSVAILRSETRNAEPDPVISLTGGPGGVTTPILPFAFRSNYRAFLENRDFIMFDQRGVGLSEPALECDSLINRYLEIGGQIFPPEERANLETQWLLDCHEAYLQAGENPALYTTRQNAADLNALREVLGYDAWNLFGVSYGTKLALTTMRDYPEGLRSVILDSVYPLESDLYTEIAANQQRAFDLLFETCANDAECSADYPAIDSVFYNLIEEFNAQPIVVSGRLPRSGQHYEYPVTGDMIADYIFSLLYVKDAIPAIPRIINDLRTQADRQAILETIAISQFDRIEGVSEGMYYAVQCAEEVRFSDRAFAQNMAENLHPALQRGFLANTNSIFDLCAEWTQSSADDSENEPVSSDIPTLVLSGEFDPITPPSWGQLVAENLENSFFYTFQTVGHGVVRSDACALQIAVDFVNDPTTAPDAACITDIAPVNFD